MAEKRYELSREFYVGIKGTDRLYYGGRQQWFATKLSGSRQDRIHHYGCGLMAASDLFMYWTMAHSFNKQSPAVDALEKEGTLLQKDYMDFVQYIRERYLYVIPKLGVPNIALLLAINSYALCHHIPYKAHLSYVINERKALRKIVHMIKSDLPVILLIGMPVPPILYEKLHKDKKIGIPFYKRKEESGKITYTVADPHVKGHYVTIIGIVIHQEAQASKEKVMLKISSWGEVYYISWLEYCQYEMRHGIELQGSFISLIPR